jgi:CheY-like chemotaxis protein
MKILIIDDEADIRRIIRLSLERVGGMKTCETPDGRAGLSAARRERPDAILLDVMMPGMDGTAMLAALRREPAISAIPVIFLTARQAPGEAERLKGLGARGVIVKPFDPMTLPDQIRDLLA